MTGFKNLHEALFTTTANNQQIMSNRRIEELTGQSGGAVHPRDYAFLSVMAKVDEASVKNPEITIEETITFADAYIRDLSVTQRGLRNRVIQEIYTKFAEVTEQSEKAYDQFMLWIRQPITLQRPTGTHFHRIREDFAKGRVLWPSDGYKNMRSDGNDTLAIMQVQHQTFLIEHNWAAALGADSVGGEVKLPYDVCFFEFLINGRVVGVSVSDIDSRRHAIILVKDADRDWWIIVWAFDIQDDWSTKPIHIDVWNAGVVSEEVFGLVENLANVLSKNIMAVSAMLDAEVVETQVTRAPHKLNHAREKRGKLPIADFRTVTLSRRHRAAPLPRAGSPDEDYTRKRLHFRRGHWRHYGEYKTWIKWMLVGDPELGFVDKMYKL